MLMFFFHGHHLKVKQNGYTCIPVNFSQSFHSPVEFYASWWIYAFTYLLGERGAKMFHLQIVYKTCDVMR